jgi:hypothetical protein
LKPAGLQVVASSLAFYCPSRTPLAAPVSVVMAAESRSFTSIGSGHSIRVVQNEAQAETSDAEKLAPSQPPSGPSEDDLFQPRSIRFWLTILCNFLALFLVALDRTIIATAVPRISDEFQALGDIGWYGSSYMLTTACAQLLFGRIYKFYDMKWYVCRLWHRCTICPVLLNSTVTGLSS